MRQYSKPAYAGRLTEGEPSSPIASKFGGQPYFENQSAWPLCTKCERSQFFICQIDLKKCSSAGLSNHFGLVQFFYCWKCYPWEPSQPGWSVINYKSPVETNAVKVDMPPLPKRGLLAKLFEREPATTAPCRLELTLFESFPQLDELETFAGKEAETLQSDILIDEYYSLVEKLSGRSDDYGTMIGGYAEWIQSMPEAGCNKCNGRLELLIQVGSEPKAGIMWGDAGAAYIMYCSQHPSSLQLFTQCF